MSRPRARVFGGVCAGFAEHTGLPVALVRLCAVVLAFAGGAGILLYAWLWATVPNEANRDDTATAARLLQRPAESMSGAESRGAAGDASEQTGAGSSAFGHLSEILVGIGLVVIGASLVADRLGMSVPLQLIIPVVVACVGAGLAWQQFGELRSGTTRAESRPAVRILGAIALVAMGILLFFVTASAPNVWTVIAAAFAVLLGVALVVTPWMVRLTRDLADERAARARDSERAVIAAHLHDSVLQSLALIQQKSEPHSDIARIARSQERDLRDWLFGSSESLVDDLPTELRRTAVELENDFAVSFDIVAVGMAPVAADAAIAAAAREAMLNAARHAGGKVSVFTEFGRDAVEVSIIDRGPGFDIESVPDDRHGVRDSIVDRMARAGGTANIARGPGGVGTQVVLRAPLHSAAVADASAEPAPATVTRKVQE